MIQELDKPIISAKIGMVLTEDVFSRTPHTLLEKKGALLTQQLLHKLTLYGIKYINAEGETKRVCLNDDWISSKVTKTIAFQRFNKFYAETKKELEKDFEALKQDEGVSLEKINKELITLAEVLNSLEQVLHFLRFIKQCDNAILSHCFNVGVLCYRLGKWFGLPNEDMKLLTLAGILHDISKVLVPPEVLYKPGKLTNCKSSSDFK